jgi:hypothetical protein
MAIALQGIYNQTHQFSAGVITINTPFVGNVLTVDVQTKPDYVPNSQICGYLYQHYQGATKGYALQSGKDILSLELPETDFLTFVPTSYLIESYNLSLKYATVGAIIDSPNTAPIPPEILSLPNAVTAIDLQLEQIETALTELQIDWLEVTGKPATFPPSPHTHTKDQIADLSLSWDAITEKPATFPPSTHTHTDLPNGIILGGVAHFWQDTPPLTRIDGSPLITGDKLIKANGHNYFYDGVDWLTHQAGGIAGRYTFVGASDPFVVENATLIGYQDLSALKIISLNIRYFLLTQGGVEDSNNYWRFSFVFRGSRNQNQTGFFNWEMSLRLDGISFPLPTTSVQRLVLYPQNPKTSFCDLAAISASALKAGSVSSILQASFVLVTRGVHP